MALASYVLSSGAVGGSLQQRKGTLVPKGQSSSMVDNTNVQLPKSASSRRRQSRGEIDGARRTMRSFAACSVGAADTRRENAAIVAFLRSPVGTPESTALANKAVKSDCLRFAGADSITMRFDDALIRGELFRILYLDLLKSPPRERISRDEILTRAASAPAENGLYGRLGECLVRARPIDAREMIVADVASPREDVAVRGIASIISGCVESGLKLQLGREMLQGILAETLYRQTAGAMASARIGDDR